MAGSLSNSTSGKSKYEIREENKIKETVSLVSKVLADQKDNSNVVIEITKVKGQYVTKVYNKDTPDQSKKIESESKDKDNKSGKDSDKKDGKDSKDKNHKHKGGFKGETNTLANRIDYALSKFWGLDAKTYRAWGYDEKDIKAVFGAAAWNKIAKEEAKKDKENEGGNTNNYQPRHGTGHGRKWEDRNKKHPGNKGNDNPNKQKNTPKHGPGNKGGRGAKHPPVQQPVNPEDGVAGAQKILENKEAVENDTGKDVAEVAMTTALSDKNGSGVTDLSDSKQLGDVANKIADAAEKSGITQEPEVVAAVQQIQDVNPDGSVNQAAWVSDEFQNFAADAIVTGAIEPYFDNGEEGETVGFFEDLF